MGGLGHVNAGPGRYLLLVGLTAVSLVVIVAAVFVTTVLTVMMSAGASWDEARAILWADVVSTWRKMWPRRG
jgi:hypothetical protein